MPSEVADWYKGRSVLITGATGFMGKVLIEKLLRAFPDLGKIYIVARPKRGLTPKARIEQITKLALFQSLREKNAKVFDKLVVIEGDIHEKDLGVSEENQRLLEEEVSVVFHVAAIVKLEAVLKDSIIDNLYGTEYFMKFCTKLTKIEDDKNTLASNPQDFEI